MKKMIWLTSIQVPKGQAFREVKGHTLPKILKLTGSENVLYFEHFLGDTMYLQQKKINFGEGQINYQEYSKGIINFYSNNTSIIEFIHHTLTPCAPSSHGQSRFSHIPKTLSVFSLNYSGQLSCTHV